jgi:hypothetical protein
MSDTRVIELLRDVDLPADPPDRLSDVRTRARRDGTRRLSAVGGALAAVLVAGVVGAFTVDTRSDAITLVDVAEATEQAGTYRVVFDVEPDASMLQGLPAGAFMRFSLDIDSANDRSIGRVQVVGADGAAAAGMAEYLAGGGESRTIGKDMWVKTALFDRPGLELSGMPAYQLAVLRAKPWVHSRTDDGSVIGQAFRPQELLRRLAQGRVVRSLPDGEVAGDPVRRTVVSVAEDVLEPGEDDSAGAAGEPGREGGARQVEATVSVDDRGRLRRLETTSEQMGKAIRVTMTITDFGIDVNVKPPNPSEVRESSEVVRFSSSATLGTDGSASSSSTTSGDPCAMVTQIEATAKEVKASGNSSAGEAYDRILTSVRQACAQSKKKK